MGAGVVSFLVDTDICSAHLKGVGRVVSRFRQYGGRLHISTVSVGELYSWVFRKSTPARHRDALEDLLRDFTVLEVDQETARVFGEVRAKLLDRGRPLPSVDLLIAATALVHDLTLVTHNVAHFADVPGLLVEDWLVA